MNEVLHQYDAGDGVGLPVEVAEKLAYAEMERKRPKFRLGFAAPGFDLNIEAAQVGNLAPFLAIISRSVLGSVPELTGEDATLTPAAPTQTPAQTPTSAPAQEKPKRTRKSEQAPEIPPPAPAPQYEREPEPELAPEDPAPPAAAPAAAPAATIDRTEIANLYLEYSTKVGMEGAKKLLNYFNAPKFRDILDSQLPEFHQRLVAAMEMVG